MEGSPWQVFHLKKSMKMLLWPFEKRFDGMKSSLAHVREDVEVEVEEELSADVEVDGGPSASEAFAALETALKWMERQPECDHLQLLTVKRMRDLAARKRLKTAKQLTLTEMFKKQ
nr:unnamed protein product [Callosobruchus chinensis]